MSGPVQRFLVVGNERIDITNCFWCGNRDDAICSACSAKADAVSQAIRYGIGFLKTESDGSARTVTADEVYEQL